MTTELAPEFAVTVRGYDRVQVDEYVDTLREWLGNATLRMEAAEGENAQLREQVMMLRNRLTQLDQQLGDTPPRSMQALGDRVTRILELAEEGAIAVQADADAEAVSILGRARQDAVDLVRAAQTRQVEMEAFIAGASEQAAALVHQAEAQGAEAAQRMLTEAEARAKASDAEAASREAQAAERARAIVADAEAERERTLAHLKEEQDAIAAELQRLSAERDEVRDGLTRLREHLHRTISDLASAPPPPQDTGGPTSAGGAAPGSGAMPGGGAKPSGGGLTPGGATAPGGGGPAPSGSPGGPPRDRPAK
jgi:cell division septum initiation protein DivIVA